MYSNYLMSKVGSLVLGVSLVSGIALVAGTAAQAQDRRDRNPQTGADRDSTDGRGWRGNRDRETRNRQINQNDRYRGRVGERDRDRNDRYRGPRERIIERQRVRVIERPRVRVIETGRYGNRGGYGNNGVYGNNGAYGNYGGGYEESRGFQDGLSTGSSDANRGQSYNPQRSHFYKQANSGVYRNGFLRGYQQGYQSYGGNGRGRIYQR